MTAKPSVLYEQHIQMGPHVRMAEFAGYQMPLWFTGIAQEHAAVRHAAGLFDCTHMGVLEVAGQGAEAFLNHVTTNDVRRMAVGQSQYAYLLNESGEILDDLILYRLAQERFLVVANASNEAKVQDWLRKILADCKQDSGFLPVLRDLRNESAGKDRRVDIALQGPHSKKALEQFLSPSAWEQLDGLKPFHLMVTRITGMDVIISRTGYTGSKGGHELFVHPDHAGTIWQMILEKGKDLAVVPCGLGARDSLRIEAGLPLYGHELNGEYRISPFEAGYGWAVKLDKPDFIGREAMKVKSALYTMQVERVTLPGGSGIRPVRERDAVFNYQNVCIGTVLSCATVGEQQIALVYVNRGSVQQGDKIGIYYLARNRRHLEEGRKDHVEKGEIVLKSDIKGKVLERFVKFD